MMRTLTGFPMANELVKSPTKFSLTGFQYRQVSKRPFYLPSLLLWNKTLDVVEKLHEQVVFRYFEDDSMSHHTDSSILYAGDKR